MQFESSHPDERVLSIRPSSWGKTPTGLRRPSLIAHPSATALQVDVLAYRTWIRPSVNTRRERSDFKRIRLNLVIRPASEWWRTIMLFTKEKHPPPHPSWKLAGNTDPLHRRALIVLLGFGQNRRLPTPLVKRESSTHLFLLLIIVRAAEEKNRGCRRVDWYRSYGRKTSFNPSLSNFKGVALWRWLALLALNSKHASQIRWHIHLRTSLPCVPRLIRTRHSLCSRFMLPPRTE